MNGSEFGAVLWKQRKRRLAACVAAILGISSPTVYATVFVTNCDDAGIGSLRNAVAGASSGDTVDATELKGACSKITLKTGAISVNKKDLTIKGSGSDALTVTAKYSSESSTHQYKNRIFTHTADGLLYLQDIAVTKGYRGSDPALGGCIYSRGSVKLKNVSVIGCEAKNPANGQALGGGIYAKGTLTMTQSTLTLNGARGETGSGLGGGAKSNGFRSYFSNVYLNQSSNSQGTFGSAGGIWSTGDTYIANSTIALNEATSSVGGIAVYGGNLKMVNSTISSNAAVQGAVGGLEAVSSKIEIFNSTITGNSAAAAATILAVGARLVGEGSSPSIVIQSSIIANNVYGPASTDNDLTSENVAITGSNNLVRASNASLPPDTIFGQCPFLGPLASNGGLTKTHKLLSRSPAIDAGNNTFGATSDQRGVISVNGEQNYPRALGPPGAGTPRADIGAYEVNGADEVFDARFESC
jgi:hypothetical protein